MRKMMLCMMTLLAFAGQVRAQEADFDFSKYRAAVKEDAFPRFAKSAEDVRMIAYALIDLDGDGKQELWVKGDEGQDWQGVFALKDDGSVVLLADADVCSQLQFFKNAVAFHSYISPGRVDEGFSVLQNSQVVHSGAMHQEFNIFTDEQEMQDEYYTVDGENVDEETYKETFYALGAEVVLTPEWHDILPTYEEIDDEK